MIIEIRKAGFVNKGAELMLRAVLQKLKERYPDAIFTMSPTVKSGLQPFHKLTALGLYPKAWLWFSGLQWGDFAALIPSRLRERYGLILDRDVDVVIDASGFSYSDQWDEKNCLELARAAKRWKQRGTKIIVMPQALGPFTSPKIRSYVRRFCKQVDLVFPRERVSYEHVTGVVGELPHIRQRPDFTNLIEGVVPEDFDHEKLRFCIVPNYRMIDKTDSSASSAYLPFLIKCTQYLREKGATPFILTHESAEDFDLAAAISDAVSGVPVLQENDPQKIKGILGACEGTLGSRYHGLVSALSQGVPSLAVGWSHKYQMLLDDYGFSDGLLQVDATVDEITKKIDLIVDQSTREPLVKALCERSKQFKALSEQTWQDIFAVIDQ